MYKFSFFIVFVFLSLATLAPYHSSLFYSFPNSMAAGSAYSLIKPSITDPEIGDANGEHVVLADQDVVKQGKLFVFLPGTGGIPKRQIYIDQTAASVGYHVIGLAYINDTSAKEECARSLNPNCQENMRMEVITGTDTSPVVDVNRANSIENRLIKLLEYLARTRPAAEGWGAFVSNGDVRWDLVVAAGHSQGGGHAAMLGKTRLLDRVAMFAATEPAAWTTTPFVTPAERFYGFIHTSDTLAPPASVITSWQNIGLPGVETSVDENTPPFNNSHQLVTSSTNSACSGDDAHGCVVTDPKTPLDANGIPIFQAVWKYLIITNPAPGQLCSQYAPSSQIPQGFGVPWDVFSPARNLLVSVSCSTQGATITINETPNSQYPYRYAYHQGYISKANEPAWAAVNYEGSEKINNAWYPGSASLTLSLTPQELSQTTYVLGYMCTYVNSAWKCGCRDQACTQSYWQIQQIQR